MAGIDWQMVSANCNTLDAPSIPIGVLIMAYFGLENS